MSGVPNSIEQLIDHSLRDAYDAESKMAKVLPRMAKKAYSEETGKLLQEHASVTEKHVERLEKIFKQMDKKPRRQPCHGISGLIEEYQSIASQVRKGNEVLDAIALATALKVEHYEIASYRTMIRMATQFGLKDAVSLLQETLSEEEQTAERIEQVAETAAGPIPVGV